MTGAVLLIVAVLLFASAVEHLVAEWRELMRTLRGLEGDARAPLGQAPTPKGTWTPQPWGRVMGGSAFEDVQPLKTVSQVSLKGDE